MSYLIHYVPASFCSHPIEKTDTPTQKNKDTKGIEAYIHSLEHSDVAGSQDDVPSRQGAEP
jgi:hypothetical protein